MSFWKEQQLNNEYQRRMQQQADHQRQLQSLKEDNESENSFFFWRKQAE